MLRLKIQHSLLASFSRCLFLIPSKLKYLLPTVTEDERVKNYGELRRMWVFVRVCMHECICVRGELGCLSILVERALE